MPTALRTGLSPAIVEQISKEKNDPLWMELFRLESLQIYNNMRSSGLGPLPGRAGYEPYRYLRAIQAPG